MNTEVNTETKPINLLVITENKNKEQILKCNKLVLSYIENLKKYTDALENSTVSLVNFNYYVHNLLNGIPLKDFIPLEEEQYTTKSSSSLNDAICMGIFDCVVNIFNYKYKLQHPDKENIVVIISDGVENSSKEYNHRNVRDLIEFIENSDGIVMFIGTTLNTMDKGKIYKYYPF